MSKKEQTYKLVFYTSANCYASLEISMLRAMEWLRMDGYEIHLITDCNYALGQEAQSRGFDCLHLNAPKYYLSFRTARQLAALLKELKPSLFFVIRPRDILNSGFSKRVFNRKLKMVFFQRSFLHLKKHLWLYKVIFKPFDAWISPSPIVRTNNLKLTAYPEEQMKVIPACIDTKKVLEGAITRAEARKQLDLPMKKFVIGVTGKYHPVNRLDFPIRCAQFLKRNNYEVDILFLSTVHNDEEKEYLDFLKELVVECELKGQVHFHGNSTNFIPFLKAIDVFAVLRETEPADLRILQAMVTPTIVAASATPYHSHLLGNGKYGILFQPDDRVDFSSKMIHLLTQPMLKEHLNDISKQQVLEHYDRHVPCQIIEKLIEQLVK